MTQLKGPIRHHIGMIAKIIFVVLVFWFLYQKDLISLAVLSEVKNHPEALFLGAGVLGINYFLGAIRLALLIRAQGISLSYLTIFKIHVVGQFFNIALPGAVSGDLVKSYYLKRHSPHGGAHALGVLLFDRITGLSAMILTSTIALYSSLVEVNTNGTFFLRNVLTLLSVGVVVFFAYLFLVTETKDPLLTLMLKMEKKWASLHRVKSLYLGVKNFHGHRGVVLLSIGISFLVQTLVGFSCFQFASALGESQLHQTQIYAIVPIGLLVTAIPILPGGVGTGHGAFSFLFRWMGSARGADVFSIYAFFQILMGLVSGLYYLKFKQDHSEIKNPVEPIQT
jgi:glycosyltransferase 2 family protein